MVWVALWAVYNGIISHQAHLASQQSPNQHPTQTPVFFLILGVGQDNLTQIEGGDRSHIPI